MRIGKFEISEFVILSICILALIISFLYFAVKEQEVNSGTEQLELQVKIEELKLKQLELEKEGI